MVPLLNSWIVALFKLNDATRLLVPGTKIGLMLNR